MVSPSPYVDPTDDDLAAAASHMHTLGPWTVPSSVDHAITTFGYPAIRLIMALVVVYLASGVSS
jgi:hypothetical protein